MNVTPSADPSPDLTSTARVSGQPDRPDCRMSPVLQPSRALRRLRSLWLALRLGSQFGYVEYSTFPDQQSVIGEQILNT